MHCNAGIFVLVPWGWRITIEPGDVKVVEELIAMPNQESMVVRMKTADFDQGKFPYYESLAWHLGAGNAYTPSSFVDKLLKHMGGFLEPDPSALLDVAPRLLGKFFSGQQLELATKHFHQAMPE